jgi:hypothetical protein
MKSVRLVSTILFYLSRVLAWGYGLSCLYAGFCLATGICLQLNETGTRFAVLFPFSGPPFLLGDFDGAFIFEMLLLLGLYGLFFWLLGNVFRTFSRPKLFTERGVRDLRYFYLGNWILPGLTTLVLAIVSGVGDVAQAFIVLHGLLGVFTFFMAAIFQQGLQLQREQDLII